MKIKNFRIKTREDAQHFVENIRDYALHLGSSRRAVASFWFLTRKGGPLTEIFVQVLDDGTWERIAKDAVHPWESYDPDFSTIHDPVEYVWKYKREINYQLSQDEPPACFY